MKRQFVHFLQKFVLGTHPSSSCLLWELPLPATRFWRPSTERPGSPDRTPVGNGRVGQQFWLVAEHGAKAGYVRNIANRPRVRVKFRNGLRARWHTGTAYLLPDDDPRERQRWLSRQHPGSASNAAAVRLFGTQLLTVRIDLDS
jgi:F420H(2)-dependent quinone reductase